MYVCISEYDFTFGPAHSVKWTRLRTYSGDRECGDIGRRCHGGCKVGNAHAVVELGESASERDSNAEIRALRPKRRTGTR